LQELISSIKTGKGQVVDSAMIDGVPFIDEFFLFFKRNGYWEDKRESNFLDGFAHFYDTYECKDNKYIAVGSIEPQFYSDFIRKARIDDLSFRSI